MKNGNARHRLTKSERMKILKKTDGHCAYCGCRIVYNEMQIDHVIPIYNGGEDTESNMLPACRSCNHYKGTSSLGAFRHKLEKMLDVLERDSVTYKIAKRFGLVVPKPRKIVFYFEQLERDRRK